MEPPIDDYAASDPAEFFAVTVETFFTGPDILADGFPEVYALLTELFQEDPLDARQGPLGGGETRRPSGRQVLMALVSFQPVHRSSLDE